MFTETNPDKGTETILIIIRSGIEYIEFTETNPDKGTETCEITSIYSWELCKRMFTETNPDKGTETDFYKMLHYHI